MGRARRAGTEHRWGLWVVVALAALAFAGCGQGAAARPDRGVIASPPVGAASPPARHPYDHPWAEPGAKRFAEGVVSTGDVFGATFEPDGRTVYFVKSRRTRTDLHIYVSRHDGQTWTPPEPLPFSGPSRDIDPHVGPNGALYFNSTRPRVAGDTRSDFDVWVAEKGPKGWLEPRNLGAPVNGPSADFFATLARSGTLYFASARGEHTSIYRAPRQESGYGEPERLPESINRGKSSNPWVAHDESFLLFLSERPEGHGDSDLYVSFRQGDTWSEAENLGPEVNTPIGEFCPGVSPDGNYLFFARLERGQGPPPSIVSEDIFYVPIERVPALSRRRQPRP